MASTTHSIRQQNKQLVLKTLFQNGALFASDLVKKTGISMVTTNSLLKELLAEGEITKGPLEQKELGRPAVTYQLNQDRGHSLLLSFIDHDGSLALWSMLIDRKGKVLAKHDQPFPDVAPHRFQECVTNELALFPSVEQIALFLPGKISGGTVTSSWYEKFNGWQLAALVAEVTALPFYCQNDAHILTIGYCIAQQISLQQTIVGMYNPEKSMPGITLLVNGALLEGKDALAGEAKFLPGYLDQGAPQDRTALVQRLTSLLPFYNAAFAPHCIILASSDAVKTDLLDAIQKNPLLQQQPNQPAFHYIDAIEKAMVLGMHWLIFRKTPFDLAR